MKETVKRPARKARSRKTSTTVDVSWGDQDPAAIVYYPHFFAWADASAQKWFRMRGVPLERLLRERKISFGLVACSAQFHSPARGGDRLTCETRLAKLAEKTIELVHLFYKGRLRVATVTEVRICMDLRDAEQLRARATPPDLRAAFSPAE